MPNAILKPQGHLSVRLPWGRLILTTDKGEAISTDAFNTNLNVLHHRDGKLIAEYDLGSGMVTNAGVNLMAADWTNATATIKLINFHDSGTGATNAAITDTTLSVPTGIARVVGVQSNINNVYKTIGVITYNSAFNITEWGLLTALTSGTLWDRRTFVSTPIPVIANDQLTWVYFLTLPSGG